MHQVKYSINLYMIPLAVFTGLGTFAIFAKAKKISIRTNELLEIENEYYKLLEKTKQSNLKFF